VLDEATPTFDYEPGTWGPPQAGQSILPPGGWIDPPISYP
jgi:glucose-6-phosphate 1-dehydrogenase